jgi:predicted acylesterase/phospholipase RssA
MTARNVQTAIVLQGGGALGAYEYRVLKALYEQRPGFRPVAVAGISIGAITAAVLGGAAGDPIRALDTLWRRKLTANGGGPACPTGDQRGSPVRSSATSFHSTRSPRLLGMSTGTWATGGWATRTCIR